MAANSLVTCLLACCIVLHLTFGFVVVVIPVAGSCTAYRAFCCVFRQLYRHSVERCLAAWKAARAAGCLAAADNKRMNQPHIAWAAELLLVKRVALARTGAVVIMAPVLSERVFSTQSHS